MSKYDEIYTHMKLLDYLRIWIKLVAAMVCLDSYGCIAAASWSGI